MPGRGRIGEFELIARFLAPLARGFEGARDLKSDNAFLPSDDRHDLVVKTDTVVAGVHFLADELPQRIAAKALRVCLSDLAAGGAAPFVYQLALALPKRWREDWIAGFAKGLAADQRRFGVILCGGDTVVTPGPLTITVTAFGKVARGRGLGRGGARAGDELWVSGTIGDGALGLMVAQGELNGLTVRQRAALEDRFRLPRPRTDLGRRLIGVATAAADVSDGLLADVGHIAKASGVAAGIERDMVPLSQAARAAVSGNAGLWPTLLGGGDDYELVMAVPPGRRAALLKAARAADVKIARIGSFVAGAGVQLTIAGRPAAARRTGYVHF